MFSIDLKKTLKIFKKRVIKYLAILMVLIGMMAPLIISSYNMAKKTTVDKSSIKLNEGLQKLEVQIKKAREIGNVLLDEKEYTHLLLLNGAPSSEYYYDMVVIQNKLNKLCMMQEFLTNAYIMFKNNPVFISNYFISDNYENVYPGLISYEDKSITDWYNDLFSTNVILKFLPNHKFFSSYYSPSEFNGITCITNNSGLASINDAILVSVFSGDEIIDSILYNEQKSESFLYITDHQNNIILSSNYEDFLPIQEIGNKEMLSFNSKKYIIIKSKSKDLGLNAVVGIPVELFGKNVSAMINLAFMYFFIGFILIVIFLVGISIKEAISFRQLIDLASKSSKTIYSANNEYSYVKNAIIQMNNINNEQLYEIDRLNSSIKACALENLFMLGIYTKREEKEILNYFSNDFEFYCVAIINLQIDDSEPVAKFAQQNMIVQLENVLKATIRNQIVSVSFNPYELACVIFFDPSDDSDIGVVRNGLTRFIHMINKDFKPTPTVSVGLSKIHSGIKTVRQAYLQAKDAINFYINPNASGVYLYSTPRLASHQKTIDIAILTKCYDVILSGDKKLVIQIFHSISENILKLHLGEQDKQQFFFSLRQPIYNAYLEITTNRPDESAKSSMEFPEYGELNSAEDIIIKFREFACSLCDIVEANKKSNNDKLKADIISYIEGNYKDVNLSAAMISVQLLISEKYVFYVIKEYTGKSLGKFIEDLRIEKAEELLRSTDYSNTKIAQVCGFGSDNTFYRAFSKKHGSSPTVWRKTNLC